MKTATVLMKNAVIENHAAGTVIDIFESDRVLYRDCEFRAVSIVLRKGVASHAFHGCLFRGCEFTFPEDVSKSQALVGYNTMLDCKFNGVEIDDFRTNEKDSDLLDKLLVIDDIKRAEKQATELTHTIKKEDER
jgi:hypothetical protein